MHGAWRVNGNIVEHEWILTGTLVYKGITSILSCVNISLLSASPL